MRHITTLALAALLAGCADYSFTVNERVVYTPAPLFSDYSIADTSLAECVAQHIADARVTDPKALEALNCSHAGVESLNGIQVFSKLVRLKLSQNRIIELQPLADMAALQELHLDDNALQSISPIRDLPELQYLDLRGNTNLRCEGLSVFRRHTGLELQTPAHCRDGD